jgi:heptosyltransferase-2
LSAAVLVVAPSWVGDAVLSQPVLALLRKQAPDVAIDVLAPAWVAPLFARMAEVRDVIPSPFRHGELSLRARWRLGRSLAQRRYARAVVLPNTIKSALVPFFARIPTRTGYLGERRYGLLNDLRPPSNAPRLVDRYAALVGDTGAAVPEPHLQAHPESRAALLQELSLSLSAPVAVMCPGAEYGPAKRWPAEHFASLAASLAADGFQVWLVGSPNDAAVGDAITALAPQVRNLCGRTSLDGAIDLISCASVAVSNDSGLMHVAAALGIPLVALFGSSSPAYTPPLSAKAQVARIEIECSPCFQRECPLGHFRCLKNLEPERVYRMVRIDPPKTE